MEKRFFTVHEANELIPFLSGKLRELRTARQQLRFVAMSAPSVQEVTLRGGMRADLQHVELVTALESMMGDICAEGCQLKDMESGLVDFPTLWEGREVVLCWKLGEREVRHWHEIEAGFSGRQELSCEP